MKLFHLDTDFLIYAVTEPGPERKLTWKLLDSRGELQMSAVAWYEFSRGPRTPEQVAVARAMLAEEGVIPFSEEMAEEAAGVFRALGSPRQRAADIAIGVTAASLGARLVTRNRRDFEDIPGLDFYP